MTPKDEYRRAYFAGFNSAVIITGRLVDHVEKEFEEWYTREVENPPEGWDDHHDS